MESHRDITIDIPGLFLDSGAPTALLRIISPVFRASTTPPEQLGEYPSTTPDSIKINENQ